MPASSFKTGFRAPDVEAVRRAVAAAEAESGGEIVPYVVAASDPYPGAAWKGAALGALAGALAGWAVYRLGGFWGGQLPFWMLLPPAAGAALAFLAVHLAPPLRRALAGAELVELRTRRRAAAAFLEQEVFATADRVGILLFLSLFERRVVVLADRGIHARVEAGEWDALVARVADGIRRGEAEAALVEGVRACGALLARHGFTRRPGQANELADDLRQGEP